MRYLLAGIVVLAVAIMGPNCPPSGQTCGANDPYCRVVLDADADGEIADDLRIARNQLLYASRPTAAHTVSLYPPPAGTYTWTGTVRFCGDDDFWDDRRSDGEEPSCVGTMDTPRIRFAGNWNSVTFAADCGDGDTTHNKITPCLHVGDLMNGGAMEPLLRVDTVMNLRFRHTQTITYLQQQFTFVPAVWLDGIQASLVALDVRGDVPGTSFGGWGSGAYVSAKGSRIFFHSEPGTGANLSFGIVLDGAMDGSIVDASLEYGGDNNGLSTYVQIGSYAGGSIFGIPVPPTWGSGPPDGCAYGPDGDGCSNFTLNATITTPSNDLGGNAFHVWGGDALTMNLDVAFLGTDPFHAVGAFGSQPSIPPIGTVTVTGSVTNATPTEPFRVGGGTVVLDATIDNLVTVPDCYAESFSGIVQTGPNYECNIP